MRGSYRKAFPRFLPAPVCLEQKFLTLNDNADFTNQFPSLLVRLRINDQDLRNPRSGEVPFDLCCPSVKELISCRICNNCGLYFASVKSVKSHQTICKANQPALTANTFGKQLLSQRRRNTPVRVAARRQQERMVIWTSRLNDQHVDWFDEEEVSNIEVQEDDDDSGPPSNVIDIETHLQVPWMDAGE